MAYIARTDIEKYLNLTLSTQGQQLVDSLIPAVEKYVEEYCNRKWSTGASSNITETFDGGTDTFFPLQVPVASVQSVTIDGTTYDLADVFNYGSYIKTESVVINKPRCVVIVYRTAANAIPEDLKQAIIQWVSDMFKSSEDAGKVASHVQSGPMSVEYAVQDGMPKFVKMVLDRYRLQPII